MTPYAYTVGRDLSCVFPTLYGAVRCVIGIGYSAARCRESNPITAHVADSDEHPDIDLTPYMERVPVDEAAVRAELTIKVADDFAAFQRAYPNGRGTERRCSGDHWLCESSQEELEHMAQREIERRAWQWKELT